MVRGWATVACVALRLGVVRWWAWGFAALAEEVGVADGLGVYDFRLRREQLGVKGFFGACVCDGAGKS